MKNLTRIVLALLILAALSAYAVSPPSVDVTISDPAGKVAFKGKTTASGTFATSKLAPGNYVVQFNSKAPSVKGSKYAIVVSAGKKKVSADAVAGEKLAAGGVAMKVDVGAGLNITGQVAVSGDAAHPGMVWIPPQLGSNMPGRWVPEGSPEAVAAKNTTRMGKQDVENITAKSYNPQGN